MRIFRFLLSPTMTCLAGGGVASFVAGCQSYERMPLDMDAHVTLLSARTLDHEDVAAYAARMFAQRDKDERVYNIADGIELDEAEAVALFFNPKLRVARLKAEIPLMRAKHAGRWDDPRLDINVQRILQGVFEPWLLGGGIGFTIPISGRLGAEQDKAMAEHRGELEEVRSEEWETIRELREQWLQWSATGERCARIRSWLIDIEGLRAIADRLAEAGEISRLNARRFALDAGARTVELRALETERTDLEFSIRALMGLAPDAPVAMTPSLAFIPMETTAADVQAIKTRNPDVRVRIAEYEIAEQTLRVEIRKQYPDLSFGPAYETEQGQSRLGLGLGLPIPLINLNKAGIAEAYAAREAARAAAEAAFDTALSALRRARVRLEAARSRQDYLERDLAPLVDRQVTEARAQAELGRLDVLLTLDAMSARLDAQSQVIETRLDAARAGTAIDAVLGPSIVETNSPDTSKKESE